VLSLVPEGIKMAMREQQSGTELGDPLWYQVQNAPVPNGVAGCRNADADGFFFDDDASGLVFDADAQL
jgi:hypothetical protein